MTARVSAWRDVLFGFVAGAWLSVARAPLGVDWIEIPAADGRTQRWFRAAGLAVIAIAWLQDRARARARTSLVLWSATLGFALHAALAAHLVEATGWRSLAAGALIAWLALTWLARRPTEDAELVPAIPLELLAFGVAGAGVGLALDRVANTLRMTSLGRPIDDSAMAVVFLALAAFGASAFGPLLARARIARLALPIATVLAAAVCWESVGALSRIDDREGLEAFLRAPVPALEALFGHPMLSLDTSRVGQLDGDLLIATRVWILPAFALGAALACASDRRRLAALAGGAALQFLLVGRGSLFGSSELPFATSRAVALATAIAALGASCAVGLVVERSLRARALAALACAVVALATWFAPRLDALPLTPWEAVPPLPYWTSSTDAGLATVERARDASRIATLDRRRLTPLDSETTADAQRLRFVGAAHQVLLVGQLTPARAETLKRLGVQRVDRTAVWWRAMSDMDRALFDDEPIQLAGDVLEPTRARTLVAQGNYDVIVIPPIYGSAPTVDLPEFPATTRCLVWLDARADICARYWGERVLLSSDGGEQLAIGIATGELGSYAPGEQTFDQLPYVALVRSRVARPFVNEARTAARLAAGARGTPQEKLTAGLALHFAAQGESSPFESRAQRVEIDGAALELLSVATLAREPDAFVRELWNGLAATLVEKREVEHIERFLAPLAERWSPWPELERALASAALEQLDATAALEHLDRAVASSPNDVELRRLRARTLASLGRAGDAVREFEAALALAPHRSDLARELAMARMRAGDPAGRAQVEELLAHDPEDDELRRYLAPGPPPAPPPALTPHGSRHTD